MGIVLRLVRLRVAWLCVACSPTSQQLTRWVPQDVALAFLAMMRRAGARYERSAAGGVHDDIIASSRKAAYGMSRADAPEAGA
jgi:hypothetical protein